MADQAFALSPISASGVSPTQSDYDAISEAFMETARGRWFLTEYAKRNRNADTAMVLDAVARIERTLTAQKDPPPNGVPDILAAVGAIVAMARANAEGAMAAAIVEDALAPSRKCARVIREIAWGLRESGADGRICTLLDAQVDAINAACDHVVASGLRDGVLKAFDQAVEHIGALADGHMPPMPAAPVVEKTDAPAAGPVVEVEITEAAAPVVIVQESIAAEASGPDAVSPAPGELPPVESIAANVTADLDSNLGSSLNSSLNSSLGASLLANGIVAKPLAPRSDPLAAIRRMSSAEKIAFFS